MQDINFERKIAGKSRIKLLDAYTQPVNLALSRIGSKTSKLKKAKIDSKLFQKILKHSGTYWEAFTVFATIKNGTLRFCFYYWKLCIRP